MKCNNCGNEFEGKFCTQCGAKASGEAAEDAKTMQETNEDNEAGASQANVEKNSEAAAGETVSKNEAKEKESESGGLFSALFDIAFLIVSTVFMVKIDVGVGWIIAFWFFAIIGFAANLLFDEEKTLCAIVDFIVWLFTSFLLIRIGLSAGLVFLCFIVIVVREILQIKNHKLVKLANIAMGVVGIVVLMQFYQVYQGYACINIAKEYQYASGVTYGDLLNNISENTEWKCVELQRFNRMGEGTYDAKVTVTGDLNKLITTGESIEPDSEYTIMFYVEKEGKERAVPQIYEYYVNGKEGSVEDEEGLNDVFSEMYANYMMQDMFLD